MSWIKKIEKIFKPIDDSEPEQLPNENPSDAFAFQDELIEKLASKLRQVYGGRSNAVRNQTLTLWIEDDSIRNMVSESHDRILSYIHEDLGLPFADVMTKGGAAPVGSTPFYGKHAFTVSNVMVSANHTGVASIRIHDGKGTLLQQEYLLDAEGGRYEIGRGLMARNAIGIVADSTDPCYELNKYVRSHHAFIDYHRGMGFCIVVQRDGSRIYGGSRTQLKRGGSIIELDNPVLPVPLQDNDIIVLGKSVELIYKVNR